MLLHDVGGPAGDTRDGEDRSEQIDVDPERGVGAGGVEVDVGVELLLALDERFVKSEKKLNANVDFYSASTYATLGVDIDLYTPIFAISRISGWAAHVIEQLDDNRLIRPRAEYIGPEYPAPYIPMAERG